MRRFVSALVVAIFAVIGARVGVDGYGIYAYEVLVLPLALIVGLVFEAKVQSHRREHRTRSN